MAVKLVSVAFVALKVPTIAPVALKVPLVTTLVTDALPNWMVLLADTVAFAPIAVELDKVPEATLAL